ncbi:AI-2E family transporter [Tessaracoccus defluvii]|uniref:AI-2E family transporter n=1 Tax=Tessaracoccus defluvii TaxID=1285901 RepID=A0A7H0H9F4_9ACTN|nr:AI-2E family transporter [Tessaracoccus defluvii]QNP57170.1 AI-2E family transporter [Tessaracoccus defluvii]
MTNDEHEPTIDSEPVELTDTEAPAESEFAQDDAEESEALLDEPVPPHAHEETPPQDVGAEGTSRAGMPRLGLVAIIVAAIGLSLVLLQNLSGTIAPMFLALNLLIAAYPIFPGLRRIGIPKPIAAVVTMLAVFVVFVLGIGAIIWSVTQVVTVLTGYSQQFTDMYTAAAEWLAGFGLDEEALLNGLKSISPSNVIDVAGSILSGTSAATAIIAVVVVGIVFLSMDIPSVDARLGITHRLHPGLTDSISAVANGIRRYWVVTTIFGLIVALINGGVIVALGISLPIVWVVLTFITNYIPNIGFVIGLVPPALLALVEKGPTTALLVVILFSVVNFILQSLIQPKFTGDAVGITPTVSFISLLVWAWVFGALGALIALPATLTVKALLIDPDPRMRWLNAFISNDPETAEVRPDHA